MLGGCISISKAGRRQCLLQIVTTKEVNKVDSIKGHNKVVSNKVDILGNSKEAITKVVISRTITMMNWKS
jgi:hypothetical protein